jgi:hypothetical protein
MADRRGTDDPQNDPKHRGQDNLQAQEPPVGVTDPYEDGAKPRPQED